MMMHGTMNVKNLKTFELIVHLVGILFNIIRRIAIEWLGLYLLIQRIRAVFDVQFQLSMMWRQVLGKCMGLSI
jgi:small basic protein